MAAYDDPNYNTINRELVAERASVGYGRCLNPWHFRTRLPRSRH
jgi:hypothetical protein